MKDGKRSVPVGTDLLSLGGSRKIIEYRKGAVLFSQGGPADAVFYILRGRVKLSILSSRGKEAVIGILNAGEFIGINCLMGQEPRQMTATTMAPSSILRIGREEMQQTLRADPEMAERLIRYVLSRKAQMEAKLADNLSFSSEKRLALALLRLAQNDMNGHAEAVIPKISQETLAAMIGTTRSRVTYFMNEFKRQGFIEYDRKLKVKKALKKVIAPD